MSLEEIESYIIKYFYNEATSEELDQLSDWISVEGNDTIFKDYIKTYFETTIAMGEPDVDKIKKTLLRDIESDKKRAKAHKFLRILKYAAVVVFLLGVGYFFRQETLSRPQGTSVLSPKDEPITITLDDGTTKIIKPQEKGFIKSKDGKVIGKQDKASLTYSHTPESQKLLYNTVKVPHGKRFDINLSDGTRVYLNAGTVLRYPVNFIDGRNRNVFLTGEAFFEVARDDENPFVVSVGTMNVEVLGTAFNVSSYPQDSNTSTVLVEGAVSLYQMNDANTKGDRTYLEPGFKAAWNKNDNDIAVENVDTELYTSWVQGKLVFRNTPFLKIRQALERHYNVKILNTDTELDEQLFDATFDIETIEEVLESFNKSYAIAYQIKNNKIIIN